MVHENAYQTDGFMMATMSKLEQLVPQTDVVSSKAIAHACFEGLPCRAKQGQTTDQGNRGRGARWAGQLECSCLADAHAAVVEIDDLVGSTSFRLKLALLVRNEMVRHAAMQAQTLTDTSSCSAWRVRAAPVASRKPKHLEGRQNSLELCSAFY